jgi:hypothetical protein
MSEQRKKEVAMSIVSGETFREWLDGAQLIVDAIAKTRPNVMASGFAACALLANVIEITGADPEWWFEIVRKGPGAIEGISVPKGGVVGENPGGKQ